jgi:hypothetical protein
MDKNIVALVREDTKTVGIRFFSDCKMKNTSRGLVPDVDDYDRYSRTVQGKEYTYVTTKNLKLGDLCLVFVGERPAIVEVTRVDDTLTIEPNSAEECKWIACVFDTSEYDKLMQQNAEVAKILQEKYQQNVRAQFRQVFLAGADDNLLKLLDDVLGK